MSPSDLVRYEELWKDIKPHFLKRLKSYCDRTSADSVGTYNLIENGSSLRMLLSIERQEALMKDMHTLTADINNGSKTMTRLTKWVMCLTAVVTLVGIFQVVMLLVKD